MSRRKSVYETEVFSLLILMTTNYIIQIRMTLVDVFALESICLLVEIPLKNLFAIA